MSSGALNGSIYLEVQAVLLNSDGDPYEVGEQGLCALYSFVSTELEGSPLAMALERVFTEMRLPRPAEPGADVGGSRKDLRKRVLASSTTTKRTKR